MFFHIKGLDSALYHTGLKSTCQLDEETLDLHQLNRGENLVQSVYCSLELGTLFCHSPPEISIKQMLKF